MLSCIWNFLQVYLKGRVNQTIMEGLKMFDYDVIVVGCGPAGLMAAAELKENGVNVLGVDKKPRLDENVRSASGFFIDGQEMNGEHIKLEHLKGKTRINYTKCGFSFEYSRPMEGIHHTHIITNSGNHFQATARKKPLYHTFNPTTWLSDRYKKAGGSFYGRHPGHKGKRGKRWGGGTVKDKREAHYQDLQKAHSLRRTAVKNHQKPWAERGSCILHERPHHRIRNGKSRLPFRPGGYVFHRGK